MNIPRTYSRLDLIQEELSKLENKSFLDRALHILLSSKHVYLTIQLPSHLVVRANVLCEDITIIGDLEKKFQLSDLGSVLFTDFLNVVRKEENFDSLYKRLQVRNQNKLEIHQKEVTYYEESEGLTDVRIRLERRDALRGEVVLSDLANLYPTHTFQLESLLELILVDFLIEYQKGTTKNTVKNILEKI